MIRASFKDDRLGPKTVPLGEDGASVPSAILYRRLPHSAVAAVALVGLRQRTRLASVLLAEARSYERVGFVAWDCRSAAGDATATWAACTSGRCTLQHDTDLGWLGRIADLPESDRQLALAIQTSSRPWTALADYPGALAFGISTSKGDLESWDKALAGNPAQFPQAWPGMLQAPVAAQLGLPLYRPVAVAAACSTGLYALLDAADALENRSVERALVGAVDCSLSPWLLAGFKHMGVLCGNQQPQAFGSPTGFAPAEGGASFALADGGPWRLVAGVRVADAGHETEFRDPATLRQALMALWRVAPGPELIITHGTGTARGDTYETAGLLAGPWKLAMRLACKPSIGHCLGASAAVELAAALQSSVRRFWKIGLGFGGHLAAVAIERAGT